MKKIVFLFATITFFLSCDQTQKKETQENPKKVDYIYEATYLDNFEIGNTDLVLKVQEMHQHIIDKNYDMVANYLADDVVFALEDGSQIEGKDACIKFMIEGYSSIEIEDYQVAVNLAVKGDNGHEWVLLWDNGTIVTADGTEMAYNWMESFQFEDDKIITMNQFSKPRN